VYAAPSSLADPITIRLRKDSQSLYIFSITDRLYYAMPNSNG